MEFVIKSAKDKNPNYHKFNPLTGNWTGWETTAKKAMKCRLTHATKSYKTIPDYLKDKEHYEHTIVSVYIKNKYYSLNEFKNLYPEYFI